MLNAFEMPKGACNAHLHIVDPAYPNDGKTDEVVGTVEMYMEEVARPFGLERAVFVHDRTFGFDHSCTLDAIRRFGRENSRGIGTVPKDISDRELLELREGGICGLRFSIWNPDTALVSIGDCLALADRCRALGMHLQLNMTEEQLICYEPQLKKLTCRLVIEDMAYLDPGIGLSGEGGKALCRLLEKGDVWVKLACPYGVSRLPKPWPDASKLAAEIADYAPERVIWGTDYPYYIAKDKPSHQLLIDMIPLWFRTAYQRQRALCDNPQELFFS